MVAYSIVIACCLSLLIQDLTFPICECPERDSASACVESALLVTMWN